MSSLALRIDNSPVFLPLFEIFDSEINGFVATLTAGKQQRKKCTVSLSLEPLTVSGLAKARGSAQQSASCQSARRDF
jgi:hypothetical protein